VTAHRGVAVAAIPQVAWLQNIKNLSSTPALGETCQQRGGLWKCEIALDSRWNTTIWRNHAPKFFVNKPIGCDWWISIFFWY